MHSLRYTVGGTSTYLRGVPSPIRSLQLSIMDGIAAAIRNMLAEGIAKLDLILRAALANNADLNDKMIDSKSNQAQ